jgi:uncharacterized membrane protein YedE/YeeE
MSLYLPSLLGGMLIGLSASLLLLLNGRIAGVSGIAAGIAGRLDERQMSNLLFLVGLLLGPVLYRGVFGAWPVFRPQAGLIVFALAGFLVGFGSRLGAGCTSGHGVCGLSRLSPRSIAAVATFMLTAIATVFVMRSFGS